MPYELCLTLKFFNMRQKLAGYGLNGALLLTRDASGHNHDAPHAQSRPHRPAASDPSIPAQKCFCPKSTFRNDSLQPSSGFQRAFGQEGGVPNPKLKNNI